MEHKANVRVSSLTCVKHFEKLKYSTWAIRMIFDSASVFPLKSLDTKKLKKPALSILRNSLIRPDHVSNEHKEFSLKSIRIPCMECFQDWAPTVG